MQICATLNRNAPKSHMTNSFSDHCRVGERLPGGCIDWELQHQQEQSDIIPAFQPNSNIIPAFRPNSNSNSVFSVSFRGGAKSTIVNTTMMHVLANYCYWLLLIWLKPLQRLSKATSKNMKQLPPLTCSMLKVRSSKAIPSQMH